MDFELTENKTHKILKSDVANYVFNKENGYMAVWGPSKDQDLVYSPFGPFILDMEVTTICGRGCKFCYKGNTKNGINMSFDTFKTIINKLPQQNGSFVSTQIAFGADESATSNPDLFKMMDYCRSVGIIPNITVANISDETADKLAAVCGAVAVSRYSNKNDCYNSVQKLVSRGMKQVNIHCMISKETKNHAIETINDMVSDERLKGMNAIVLLSLKKKGRGLMHNPLSQEDFNDIVKLAQENKISYGFDSCSQKKFLKAIEGHSNAKMLESFTTGCESTCESAYINTEGVFYSCSFCEDSDSFPQGLNVVECEDFIKDIWMNPITHSWRQKLIENNFACPAFEV